MYYSTRTVIALVSFLSVVSCNDNADSNVIGVEFLAYKAPCVSLFQQLCFVIPSAQSEVDELFYDAIEGFDFVWGHSYQLSLIVTEVDNPPSDGSSIAYSLDAVLSDLEDTEGTLYEFELVELLDNTFTYEFESYYFLGKEFSCGVGVDCDGLVDLNNSGGLVNVVFEYLGAGELLLSQWS